MRIVFIHGRAQEGKDPKVLQREWEDAFARGLQAAKLQWPEGVEISFPYYGDELDSLLKQLDAPLAEQARSRGVESLTSDRQLRSDILSEIFAAQGVSERELIAEYRGDANKRGPENWEWIHSILKVLDRTPLGSAAIDLITRDVSVYLSYRAIQERIDEIVAPTVSTEPCVVVGHSLGSIVGYNVLSRTSARVVRYVTVGSPLGIKAIKAQLESPLKMPPSTVEWFNAMDDRDVVSLYPLDQDHFGIAPPITNKTTVRNDTDNRHGISGYLSDPDVARWIVEGLRR